MNIRPTEDRLLEIIGHLGAAVIQRAPSDDQIIMDHVQDAYELALQLRRDIAKATAA